MPSFSSAIGRRPPWPGPVLFSGRRTRRRQGTCFQFRFGRWNLLSGRTRLLVSALLFLFTTAPAWAGPAWLGELLPAAPATGVRDPGGLRPQAPPEIFGPGKVTTLSNVWMKVTNAGTLGNGLFLATSSDPDAQWPAASGVEYLFFATVCV